LGEGRRAQQGLTTNHTNHTNLSFESAGHLPARKRALFQHEPLNRPFVFFVFFVVSS